MVPRNIYTPCCCCCCSCFQENVTACQLWVRPMEWLILNFESCCCYRYYFFFFFCAAVWCSCLFAFLFRHFSFFFVCRLFALRFLGSFLLESFFLHNFQTLEIIGGMYQYTKAFCHYSWNSPEAKKSCSLNFTYLETKIRKIWKLKKFREKIVDIYGKKNSPIRMTLKIMGKNSPIRMTLTGLNWLFSSPFLVFFSVCVLCFSSSWIIFVRDGEPLYTRHKGNGRIACCFRQGTHEAVTLRPHCCLWKWPHQKLN